VGEIELADGVDELVPTFGDDHFAGQKVFVHPGCLEKAAGYGEHHAHSAIGGIEAIVRGEVLRLDAALLEHVSQLRKGEDGFDLLVDEVDRRSLLGHARTHEDHLEVLAHVMAERARHRHHGGDQRGQVGHQAGMILAHVRHHRRTGSGDVALIGILFEQTVVGFGHEIGAQRHLVDRVEAERSDHRDQSTRRNIDELRGEAGCHQGRYLGVRFQQAEHPLRIVADLLRVLAADP